MQIYLSEVLDWYTKLKTENKWDEREYSSTRKKLLVALDGISGYNAEILLQRLPLDALYEERALLLGIMNQHQFALIIYVHKVFTAISSDVSTSLILWCYKISCNVSYINGVTLFDF